MHEVSEKPEIEEQLTDVKTKQRNSGKEATRKGSTGANFANSLLENSDLRQPKKTVDFLISLVGQSAFVILLILLPLCYTQAFNLPEYEKTFLVIPPPPPPPPASVPARVLLKPRASLLENGKLYAPRIVPKHIEMIKEAPQESPGLAGVAGGVPGGVPGGTLGGVLGGILSPAARPIAPPPPKPMKSNRPLMVGGNVQAPRLMLKIQPSYPPLARETRTQGVVVVDCVIDEHGNVTQVKLVSGHPLLIRAALDAVRQWKYQPTRLNGVPIAVEMEVTVNFRMES
jgi:protein TonB